MVESDDLQYFIGIGIPIVTNRCRISSYFFDPQYDMNIGEKPVDHPQVHH